MATLFTRVPNWIREALGTYGPALPNAIGTGPVEPVLDVYQGGWSVGQLLEDETSIDIGASPSAWLNVIRDGQGMLEVPGGPDSMDEDHAHVILGLGVGNGSAAAYTVQIMHGSLLWVSQSLAAGSSLYPYNITSMGGGYGLRWPWIVPPGSKFQLKIGTGGPWYIRRVMVRLPAGSALL